MSWTSLRHGPLHVQLPGHLQPAAASPVDSPSAAWQGEALDVVVVDRPDVRSGCAPRAAGRRQERSRETADHRGAATLRNPDGTAMLAARVEPLDGPGLAPTIVVRFREPGLLTTARLIVDSNTLDDDT